MARRLAVTTVLCFSLLLLSPGAAALPGLKDHIENVIEECAEQTDLIRCEAAGDTLIQAAYCVAHRQLAAYVNEALEYGPRLFEMPPEPIYGCSP